VSLKQGRLIIYVENISLDHKRMGNVFIAEQTNSQNDNDWHITDAKGGYQLLDPKTGALFFVTNNGYRYEGQAGEQAFRIMSYGRYGVKIHSHPGRIDALAEDVLPTLMLWHLAKSHAHYAAELQWRFAMPLSALLLGLLAVPLSKVKPKHSKYAQLIPSILLYIVYVNLLLITRAWIENGILSPMIGLWSIHSLMLMLTCLLLPSPNLWLRLAQKFKFARRLA